MTGFVKNIMPVEDARELGVCDICLQNYPEDDLEEHQAFCMPRVVFRCSACDGNYVSKEGMWNHLDLHEIADESKELHYQELRATYKLYQCVLCNDHRGYQDRSYWRHVQEEHDGFFLRCLDCGKNFRSEQRKADHNCNTGEQNEDAVTNTEQDFKTIDTEIAESNPKETPIESTDIKCQYCDEEFSNELALTRHMERCHSLFKCDICGTTANTKSQLRYHKVSHMERKHKCPDCPKAFHFSSAYQRHMAKHESEKKIACPLCGNKFKSIFGLSWHTNRFHKEKKEADDKPQVQDKVRQLGAENKQSCEPPKESHRKEIPPGTSKKMKKCPYCTKECHDESELSRHYLYSHKPADCAICKKSFQGTSNYRYHKLVAHTEPRHKCPHCEQCYHLKIALQRHILVHQNKREVPCDMCGVKFKSSNDVKRHQKRAHGVKRKANNTHGKKSSPLTRCPFCEDTFDDEHLLCQHVETIHQISICTLCGMTFLDTITLENHKKKHHSVPKYNCIQCDEKFNVRKYFYRHMAAHKKQTKFECKICNKQCAKWIALQSHMANDHNIGQKRVEPQLTCSICGITATGKFKLNFHKLKFHTEPRFQCSHCSRKFITNCSYMNHLQSHKNLNFPCNFCSLEFRRLYILKAHVKKRHAGQSLHVLQVQQNNTQSNTQCDEGSLTTCEEIDIKDGILENTTPTTNEATCSQCHQTFGDANELLEHMKVNHPAVKECLICGLTFSSTVRFKLHMLVSHKRPRLKCSQCPKMFHNQHKRDKHEMTHTENEEKKPLPT